MDTNLINSTIRQRLVPSQYFKLRVEVLYRYGGSDGCACCGELRVGFLSLDHISGDGAADRRRVKGTLNLMRDLKRRGWPSGYQVLCHNCNWFKGTGETCECKSLTAHLGLDALMDEMRISRDSSS